MCLLAVAGAIGVIVLDILDRARIHSLHAAQPTGIVLPISFSVLGAIIASRQPGNRIGWIYLLIGVLIPWQSLGSLYYERSVLSGGLPGASWAAWLSNWATILVFPAGLSMFAFLLFPSGHLPSQRWRPVVWLAALASVIAVAPLWVDSTPFSVVAGLPDATSPIGLVDLGSATQLISSIGFFSGLALLTAAIVSLVLRARRAVEQERQQVKLLAYAAAVTIGVLLLSIPAALLGLPAGDAWWDISVVLGFGIAVPLACGLAILKHGLYEIDRLISRTITYVLLTGLLAGVFIGIVALATDVLPFSSPIAVAASTLAAAGLFNPLRRRVQRAVDRRFNRGRYDAEAIVAAFTMRLRDAVDLDTIRAELLATVEGAVHPAHASVWIRSAARPLEP